MLEPTNFIFDVILPLVKYTLVKLSPFPTGLGGFEQVWVYMSEDGKRWAGLDGSD